MSDTCIVCLGDLNASAPDLPLPSPPALEGDPGEPHDVASTSNQAGLKKLPGAAPESELIAHLLPCGHSLHDECLKPWVERANSCPICRQNFNQVELCNRINGPVISSYAVSDRIQVADIDPSMLIEELDEPDFPPCSICGHDDHEDVLMACDGCESSYHTYCVSLGSVPPGSWFCETCEITRAIDNANREHTRPLPRANRTRTQARRLSNRAQDTTWSRIWQTVFDRTSLDIDFPFNDNAASAGYRQSHRRGGPRALERRIQIEERLRVAEQQGASSRFRDYASELEGERAHRPRPAPPEPESIEEIAAWNAFEKARDIQADPAPKSRKRKSVTSSPADPDHNPRRKRRKSATTSPCEPTPAPQVERRLKRPQTRRAHMPSEPSPDAIAESSTARRRSLANRPPPDVVAGNAPSFLQSLLTEVATSAIPDEPRTASVPSNLIMSDHPSPGISSPGASPTASSYPSPRAMSATPPPPARSPPPLLTSKIEPLYPLAPDLSSSDALPLAHPQPHRSHRNSKSQNRVGRWAIQTAQLSSPPRPRSEESSPTRANMSLTAKENVQSLVKEALKIPYQNKKVSKDQYTDINRSISRMLYDKIGEDGLVDAETGENWKKLASDEVEKALLSLQETTT